ncbi:MAG: tRNA pseudouridine(38-40) synthase TruA [Proteobacteria bacterium]|nr:MAG: tRNA pseudouridine(38-40) synthase TruA [Pseudomonadota bacterium]
MPNLRLVVEYDGTDFEGWQRQPRGARTVQGALEAAIAAVTGCSAGVHGAGRTDAGVHAQGQVANVQLATRLAAPELRRALNAVLPRDVAVVRADVVGDAFHARRDALSKLYVYRLWTGVARSPLRDRTSLWVRAPHDLVAMREAAAALQGTHDFASFQGAGSAARSTVRTLARAELRGVWGGEVELAFEGPGFLRHMVRNLVGTLLDVGRGRLRPDRIADVLAARDRAAAGPTAPARGLVLVRVRYGDFPAESEGLQPATG